MKCKKVKRLLPLYAGNDLSLRMASVVKSHLSGCPECRREYKVYIQSLQEIKGWLKSERIDWDEAEWQQSVKRASAGRPGLQPDTAVIKQTSSQEVVEITLASRESSLKVKWFLNKNFNLEEENE
jgi:membrane carboxypeptidase/penicillin-binding protein PbpC